MCPIQAPFPRAGPLRQTKYFVNQQNNNFTAAIKKNYMRWMSLARCGAYFLRISMVVVVGGKVFEESCGCIRSVLLFSCFWLVANVPSEPEGPPSSSTTTTTRTLVTATRGPPTTPRAFHKSRLKNANDSTY